MQKAWDILAKLVFCLQTNNNAYELSRISEGVAILHANMPIVLLRLKVGLYHGNCVLLLHPSAVNFQPWRFRIVTDEAVLKALYSCYKREWLATAPCIIVACVDHNESWHRRADNKDHADIDIAIAVEHLCLAAAEQGLGTCWVCNFDAPQCSEVLGLPENLEPAV